MTAETLPLPQQAVALLINNHGDTVVVGDQSGDPFPTEEAAQQFVTAYSERYPGVKGIALPIIPAALDF